MSHETGQDATTGSGGRRVDHYAADHGLQVATVRKRIQRGQLVGYKGADHRWYVLEDELPDATGRDATRDATGHATRQDATAAVAVNANARAQLEAIRDEWLQPLVETISQQAERIGRLEAERESVGAQLAAKNETLIAKDELIADLRTELRRRAERDRLTAAQAVPAAPGTTETPTPDDPSGAASAGFWARVRRVFGGERG